ncbi:hypothetical protein [Wolbachia endosymbiont of Cylisticus convexus]|nr:hypothetical protein [Wolbachia endosymbiont of Cylisticus convexus]
MVYRISKLERTVIITAIENIFIKVKILYKLDYGFTLPYKIF